MKMRSPYPGSMPDSFSRQQDRQALQDKRHQLMILWVQNYLFQKGADCFLQEKYCLEGWFNYHDQLDKFPFPATVRSRLTFCNSSFKKGTLKRCMCRLHHGKKYFTNND